MAGVTCGPGPPEARPAELGIAVADKTMWEKGFGTDAMRTLCRVGFREMNLHRIELWVQAANAPKASGGRPSSRAAGTTTWC